MYVFKIKEMEFIKELSKLTQKNLLLLLCWLFLCNIQKTCNRFAENKNVKIKLPNPFPTKKLTNLQIRS